MYMTDRATNVLTYNIAFFLQELSSLSKTFARLNTKGGMNKVMARSNHTLTFLTACTRVRKILTLTYAFIALTKISAASPISAPLDHPLCWQSEDTLSHHLKADFFCTSAYIILKPLILCQSRQRQRSFPYLFALRFWLRFSNAS